MLREVERGVLRRMHAVLYIIGLVFFLFISPIAILYFGLIPFTYRLWLLAIYTVIVAVVAFRDQRTLRSLGLRTNNFKETVLPYVIFTTGAVALLLIVAHLLGKQTIPEWTSNSHLLFLFIPISFTQEFLYRGFLMHELRRFYTSILSVIAVDALLFTYLHVLYGEPFVTLPLALVSGVAFSYMYYKYPNLWMVALSHSVLNFVAVLYSFF